MVLCCVFVAALVVYTNGLRKCFGILLGLLFVLEDYFGRPSEIGCVNISLNHLYKQLTPLRKHNTIPNLETQAGRQTTTQNEIVEVVETDRKSVV